MNSNAGISFVLGNQDDQICNHLSREFCEGFREIGFNAQTIKVGELQSSQEYADHFRSINCGLCIGIAGLGLDHFNETITNHDLNIPFLTMVVDPCIVFMERIGHPLKNNFISTLSTSDADFCREHFPSKAGSFQLNHAATPKEITPWEEKDIDFFYCASLPTVPEQLRASWQDLKPGISKILNEIVECHLASNGASLMKAVTYVLNSYPTPYSMEVFANFFAYADRYFRDLRRVATLKKIMNDVPVLLAGNGWENAIDINHPNMTYLGRIHPTEVRKYNERSKMVLNVMNNYHESHERVFSSMADGAISVSSNSPLYDSAFNKSEGIFFNWDDTDINDRIINLLSDDDAMRTMANKGTKAFLANHTWAHRAKDCD